MNYVVKVITLHSFFGALPSLFRRISLEKAPRGGSKIFRFTRRGPNNHVNIRVFEPFTDVFPRLPAIETADDSAVFQCEINTFGIFGIDVDMTYVALVRGLRKIPLIFYFLRHFYERLDFFPRISAILAVIQMNRLGSSVNDPIIGGIHGDPANIAFQHPIPVPPVVPGAIETVESYSRENDLWILLTSINGIDDFFFEVGLEFPRTSHGGPTISAAPKEDHSRLSSCIKTIRFGHDLVPPSIYSSRPTLPIEL